MTFSDWVPIVIAIIAAGPGLAALLGQKRKDKRDDATGVVDNAGKVTAQALTLIQPLNLRITELDNKVINLRKEADERDALMEKLENRLQESEGQIRRLKFGIKKLIDQIIRLGHIPEWQPDYIDEE